MVSAGRLLVVDETSVKGAYCLYIFERPRSHKVVAAVEAALASGGKVNPEVQTSNAGAF